MGLISDWFIVRAERDFYKARCEDLENKLFAEIDSNRLREDEFKVSILEMAGARSQPGGRRSLSPGTTDPQDEEISAEIPDALRRAAEEKADAFIAYGEEQGRKYTPEIREEMIENILADMQPKAPIE